MHEYINALLGRKSTEGIFTVGECWANDRELRYESATCIATMCYLLKGVPFIYQGQEFGVTAPYYDDISYFNDVESLNFYTNKIICNKDRLIKVRL